jgi:hypothetical protein
VAIFAPHPLLTVTLEREGDARTDPSASRTSCARRPNGRCRQVVARMTLRVRDDARDPPLGERGDAAPETGSQRSGRGLEQHPAAGSADRDHLQLLGADPFGFELGELPAGRDSHADPGRVELSLQQVHARRYLADLHLLIGTDVRRGDDDPDAVAFGLTRHRDAVLDVARTIVQSRQDVAVQVDQEEEGDVVVPSGGLAIARP